ncbi:hypothetical protein E0L36_23195 [Streptomyces sp. AJS327]|uniref:helix-turn-helix domain-containing protein n=1 Tax=Streptomyces sp. AJS327 TaxID=2545265 RepID=UPI0015DD5B1A|nr:helix-turn-helix domain-containing protein [Streptomyces sp. AJS327]MBA0053666.1 hypothetical protein [Streptomyces sp. AJS327]
MSQAQRPKNARPTTVGEGWDVRVWRLSRSRRATRLVMLALARHADTTGRVEISQTGLAQETLLTERTVRNCLAELVRMNELRVRREGSRNEYQITLGAQSQRAPAGAAEEDASAECRTEYRKSETTTRNSVPEFGSAPSSRARADGTPFGSTPSSSKPASPGRSVDEAPPTVRPLVDALSSSGMVVGWRLSEAEWTEVDTLVGRWGVPQLVDLAGRRWDSEHPPRSARYLLRVWGDLPEAPPTGADGRSTSNVSAARAGWRPYRNTTAISAYENGF